MELRDTWFKLRLHGKEIRNVLYLLAEGIILLASIGSLFVLIYQFGFTQGERMEMLLYHYRLYLLLAFFTGITVRYLVRFIDIIQEKMLYLDIALYLLLFGMLSAKLFFRKAFEEHLYFLRFLGDPHIVYALLFILSTIHLSRQVFTLLQSRIRPSLIFVLSFVFFIIVGWGLLLLPNATTHGISLIDALFTSATSVCITGLVTVDIATTFTRTGHIIILILSQIGGIGVMTFTSFIALSFMKNSSYSVKLMLKDMLSEEKTGGLFRVIVNILSVTLFIEGIGTYLIYMQIRGTMYDNVWDELFFSFFHSVAAFCCSGLSTLSGGYTNPLLVNKYLLHVWISLLVIFGSLGFPIVFNYLKWLRHLIVNRVKVWIGLQKRVIYMPGIINLHSYVVILMTFVLVTAGFISYLALEYNHTLEGLSLDAKLAESFLGAVTPRTAGITAIETTSLAPTTLLITIILMIIGGGPMSTAGGLKVTTVFVAFITAWSHLKEKENVEVKRKELAEGTIKRAFTIIFLYFLLLGIIFSLLSLTEKGIPLFVLLFESVSALSTVGLSMDCTPQLSDIGKVILVVTMLIGRIGLLTFFATFWVPSPKKNYLYPKENILM